MSAHGSALHRGTIALATAGVTGAIGVAGLAWKGLTGQAQRTTRQIEQAAVNAAIDAGLIPPDGGVDAGQIPPPVADGIYPPFGGVSTDDGALRLVMIGDSTAVGYGTARPDDLPGVLLARGVAAQLDTAVRLVTVGRVGAESPELADQVTRALEVGCDLAVVVIGANDISGKLPPTRSAHLLGAAVGRLRESGAAVVVATCPDFGVIAPIPQPLRSVLTRWSRGLAALQARATTAAGGTPVSMAKLVSPFFRGRPDMFYGDGFHPNAAGYRVAVDALLPACVEALLDGNPDAASANPGEAASAGQNPRSAANAAMVGEGSTPSASA